MPPQILIRAADARPLEMQDLLPADTRFKVIIFAGDVTDAAQRTKVDKLAEEMSRPESFLKNVSLVGKWDTVFDILAISSGKKETFNYTLLPELFRSHWSKCVFLSFPPTIIDYFGRVLIDDIDLMGTQGGKAYASFGVGPSGAVVIVRPDGYVGFVSPLDALQDINDYFMAFMKVSRG
jgi:phenol 2-monooxygenase (NADPH)